MRLLNILIHNLHMQLKRATGCEANRLLSALHHLKEAKRILSL